MLDTFPKERLKFWKTLSVCMSRTGKINAGRVNFFDIFTKERLKYFVISTPEEVQRGNPSVKIEGDGVNGSIFTL